MKGRISRKLALNFGKVIIDIGKLVFGGVVIGTIVRGDIEHAILLTVGSFFSDISCCNRCFVSFQF
jgi:hypothetical protein